MNYKSDWEIYKPSKESWFVSLCGNYKIMCIDGKQPNRFHRWMQKVFLGLKWDKIDENR